jgi:hypothetical protein
MSAPELRRRHRTGLIGALKPASLKRLVLALYLRAKKGELEEWNLLFQK